MSSYTSVCCGCDKSGIGSWWCCLIVIAPPHRSTHVAVVVVLVVVDVERALRCGLKGCLVITWGSGFVTGAAVLFELVEAFGVVA